jgi:hypothetical protein
MVSLETRISIKSMLLSSDKEVKTLGWNLFINEYETVIVKRIRLQEYPDLTSPSQAVDFLTRSIANTKRRMKK